ncbi:MAG: hypothetical protein ACW99F_14820, partial [Candidatus Hodarchaeales archaeon]
VHDPRIIQAVEHYCEGVLKLKKQTMEDKDPSGSDILQIIKVPGMGLTELDNTEFIFRPTPGHIELTPLL